MTQAADVPPEIASAVVGISIDGGEPRACSAVMIAPRVALTARHCAFERSSARPRPDVAVVSRAGRHPVIGHQLASGSPFGADGRLIAPQLDWAYLELGGSPAPSYVAFVGSAGLVLADAPTDGRGSDPLVKLDRNGRSARCTLVDQVLPPDVFAFRCGANAASVLGPGRSGSGLFVELEAGLALIGIHVAAVRQPSPGYGLAIAPPQHGR